VLSFIWFSAISLHSIAPGAYSPEKSGESTPKYTFGLKTQVGKPTNYPAPGAYSPEKSVDALTDTPKYTFGLKTNLEKPSTTPGMANSHCRSHRHLLIKLN
jgi:Sperm-tail PG-rich repeat